MTDPVGTPVTATPTDLLKGSGTAAPTTQAQALAMIETLKGDKDFYARLQAEGDRGGRAHAMWDALLKQAFPSPANVSSVEDIVSQSASRMQQQTETHIQYLLGMADLTPQAQQELRERTPLAASEQKWAREEISRLKRDQQFIRRYLDGDKQATTQMTLLHKMITQPTSSAATTYPVKS